MAPSDEETGPIRRSVRWPDESILQQIAYPAGTMSATDLQQPL